MLKEDEGVERVAMCILWFIILYCYIWRYCGTLVGGVQAVYVV